MISLRERLAQGPDVLATFVIIDAPEIVELCAIAGFDAVVIDCEHGPFDVAAVGRLVVAAHSRSLYAVTRVRTNDASLIGSVLDAGSDGVLVPQISSVESGRAGVQAARFAPDGHRGANPYVRAANFRSGPEWFAEANASTAFFGLVEGLEGVAALDDLLRIDGFDCVFVGPVDLSHAMGVPGQTEHPLVLEKIGQIVASAQARGVSTAIFAPTPAAARRARSMGVRFVALSIDTAMVLDGMRVAVEATRS